MAEKKTEKVVTKVMVRPPQTKTFTFDQWFSLRGRPTHHAGGMKAFLGSKASNKYTLEEWDNLIATY